MNKFIKKITKGIILSLILIFVLNLTAIQVNQKTVEHSQIEISEYSLIPTAYAEDPVPTPVSIVEPSPADDFKKTMETIKTGSEYIHRLFSPLINFFAFNIGNFLGNDYIFGGEMGTMLKRIWVVSRNLVNIIFVLILLFLALKEIFWIKEEGGTDLKKSMLTFVLLLVAVNFSWLATKIILDSANIATNIVFSIPMGISSAGGEFKPKDCEVKICGEDGVICSMKDQKYQLVGNCSPSEVYVALGDGKQEPKIKYFTKKQCEDDNIKEKYSGTDESAYGEDGEMNIWANDDNSKYWDTTTFCWETLNLAKYDQNTSVIYLTYGMARIQNIINASGTADTPGNVAIGVIFSLVLQAAYAIALLALFIVLVARMAILWLFVAFSPFMVLMLFGDVIGKFTEGAKGKLDFGGFLKWAFVPVKVAAIFTVSFLMISVGQTLGGTEVETVDAFSAGGADMSYKIYNTGSLFMGLGGLNQFIWYLITLGVLWMGVFAVLQDMPIVGKITDKINEYGKSTAGLIAKTPYWAPIMPMIDPKTGKFKFGSYEKEYGDMHLKSVLEEAREKAKGDDIHDKAGKMSEGDQTSINSMTADEAFKKLKDHTGASAQEIKRQGGVDKMIKEMKHLNETGKKALRDGYKNALKTTKAVKESGTPTPPPVTPAPAGPVGAQPAGTPPGPTGAQQQPAKGPPPASPQPGGGTKPQGDD